MSFPATTSTQSPSPFDLGASDAYQRWRDAKLAAQPSNIDLLMVEIKRAGQLSPHEKDAMVRACRRANMVIYSTRENAANHREILISLGAQLGLRALDPNLCADEDAITPLQVSNRKERRGYIPYSSKPLSWHTDGYYNPPERTIRSWALHCAQDAAQGGANAYMDPEIVYLLMREENPDWIRALMAPDALTIPANHSGQQEIRAARTGPVFSIDGTTGSLHMRYTARTKSIEWKQDAATLAAVEFIQRLLASDSPCILHHRLEPGQGIISNNVLHNRSGFLDDPETGKKRLIYRARYYDRIARTGVPADERGRD